MQILPVYDRKQHYIPGYREYRRVTSGKTAPFLRKESKAAFYPSLGMQFHRWGHLVFKCITVRIVFKKLKKKMANMQANFLKNQKYGENGITEFYRIMEK